MVTPVSQPFAIDWIPITCTGCVFFDQLDNRTGLCRRRAPRKDQTWPEVKVDDWCGDGLIDKRKRVLPPPTLK